VDGHTATTTAAPSRFATDTAVTRVGAGRYLGVVDPGWAVIDGAAPNGGYLLALAARAMREPLPHHPDPVTLTAHFLAPAVPGELLVDVEVVRTGRRHATVAATVTQGEREVARLLGTFGDLSASDGPTRVDRPRLSLPPLDDCAPVTDQAEAAARAGEGGVPAPPILLRFDHRMPSQMMGWTRGAPTGRGEVGGYVRWRDGAPMDPLGLLVVADCYPPAVFNAAIGGVGWVPTIELTVQVRKRPSPGFLATRFTTEAVTAGYLEEDGEVWDADGDLVVLSRQLALASRAD
jgi:acyl-CoA thioesterase